MECQGTGGYATSGKRKTKEGPSMKLGDGGEKKSRKKKRGPEMNLGLPGGNRKQNHG